MFRRHYEKRSTNIVIVIFRMILSVVMLTVLVVGIYSAYKHFSGLDPLKLDPQAILSKLEIFSARVAPILPKQINQKVLNQEPKVQPNINVAFRLLLIADLHNDNTNLEKAINQAKAKYPDLQCIIGLGDYTEVGTIEELKNTKAVLDKFALRYFLVPGDHDLWDCRNKALVPTACFEEVYGPAYQSFTFNNFKFLLLDNSDNYTGFDSKQLGWLTTELDKGKEEGVKGMFVFLHEPLYHPSSDHVMGWVEKNLKSQSLQVSFQLKEAGVSKIFAGHIHYFSDYLDPKTGMSMLTIGAITTENNAQAPRFAVMSVLEDGSVKVEDMEIK